MGAHEWEIMCLYRYKESVGTFTFIQKDVQFNFENTGC